MTENDTHVWASRADELATAAMLMLNREDACGGYRKHPTTRKQTDGDWLDMPEALLAHFKGERTIGLHSTSQDNTCRWIAFDIDGHDIDNAAGRNHRAAMEIACRLRHCGLKPYIFSSDGRAGYHVWAKLHAMTPSQEAFALARQIGAGLDVECFPKQPQIREGGYGNWIRLPGRHYKRDHWSRLWTDSGWASAENEGFGISLER